MPDYFNYMFMDYLTIDYMLRLVARVGFALLLWGTFRLWRLPVLEKHSNQLFWLAVVIVFGGLLFTTFDFLFAPTTSFFLSFIFNTFSTWLLAAAIHWRADKIESKVGTERAHHYREEVNRRIEELKRGT